MERRTRRFFTDVDKTKPVIRGRFFFRRFGKGYYTAYCDYAYSVLIPESKLEKDSPKIRRMMSSKKFVIPKRTHDALVELAKEARRTYSTSIFKRLQNHKTISNCAG